MKFSRIAIVGAVATAISFLGTGTAYANAYPAVFAGYIWYSPGIVMTKIDSEIQRRSDTYINASYPQAVSAVWNMLGDGTHSTSTDQWFAQVGWFKSGQTAASDGIYYFFEEHEGPLDPTQPGYKDIQYITNGNNISGPFTGAVGPATGYWHDYVVSYNASTYSWTGTVDGAYGNLFTTTDQSNWSADEAYNLEEVQGTSYARFFGGTSGNSTWYTNCGVQTSDGTWHYPSWQVRNTDTYDAGESISSNGSSSVNMYVWDVRGNN